MLTIFHTQKSRKINDSSLVLYFFCTPKARFLYIINAVNYPSAEENSNFAAAMEIEIYGLINLVK